MPCRAVSSTRSSSSRRAMLYRFCTHATGAIACASASCPPVTVLSPRCRIRPCCRSSASASNCGAIEPGSGPSTPPIRRFTTSSTSSPRRLRLSWTCSRSSAGVAGVQPAALPVAPGAHFGDDVQIVRVRRERLADELVGDVRPVVIGRVDVGDAEVRDGAQHRQRLAHVFRRPEYARAGQLHGAVADPGQAEIAGAIDSARLLLGHALLLGQRLIRRAPRGCRRDAPAARSALIPGPAGPGSAAAGNIQ